MNGGVGVASLPTIRVLRLSVHDYENPSARPRNDQPWNLMGMSAFVMDQAASAPMGFDMRMF